MPGSGVTVADTGRCMEALGGYRSTGGTVPGSGCTVAGIGGTGTGRCIEVLGGLV